MLVLSIYLAIFSWFFMSKYQDSKCTEDNLWSVESGVYYLMLHAETERVLGSVVASIVALALIVKLINILSFVVCPLKMLKFKKAIRDM